MNPDVLKGYVNRIPRDQSYYRYKPENCPAHGTWAGKVFLGHLFFNQSKCLYQVFECPLCGLRDAVEVPFHGMDVDDPRYHRAACPTPDWLKRKDR